MPFDDARASALSARDAYGWRSRIAAALRQHRPRAPLRQPADSFATQIDPASPANSQTDPRDRRRRHVVVVGVSSWFAAHASSDSRAPSFRPTRTRVSSARSPPLRTQLATVRLSPAADKQATRASCRARPRQFSSRPRRSLRELTVIWGLAIQELSEEGFRSAGLSLLGLAHNRPDSQRKAEGHVRRRAC